MPVRLTAIYEYEHDVAPHRHEDTDEEPFEWLIAAFDERLENSPQTLSTSVNIHELTQGFAGWNDPARLNIPTSLLL
ncbi:hypothetical protein RAD16_12765 [Bradyrhizobium sp. 18BD]